MQSSISETLCGSDDDDFDLTELSFSNGDDNNHDFCGNDGQLCDVRDMMILKCTNILPPPPQHHDSNITNFFYK